MVIGITGGIGCGKSTVLNIIKEKYSGYVIDADKVAHRLMEPGNETYYRIREFFGEAVIGSDGYIDRNALGKIVFSDKTMLQKLNSIVHPAVKRTILDEIIQHKEQLIAVEAALLIEAGYMDIFDDLWYIYTDNNTRIKRLMESRGYSREKAESIILNQLSDLEFRKHCTKVIDNSLSVDNTLMQIERLIVL